MPSDGVIRLCESNQNVDSVTVQGTGWCQQDVTIRRTIEELCSKDIVKLFWSLSSCGRMITKLLGLKVTCRGTKIAIRRVLMQDEVSETRVWMIDPVVTAMPRR